MALVITEDADSRKARETRREGRLELTFERRFTITGSDDTVAKEVRALGPQVRELYGDGSLGLFAFDRDWSVLRPGGAAGAIRLVVMYGPPERLPENEQGEEPEFEFSTMAETAHIERALDQQHYPASSDDVDLLIGINKDDIAGVDIFVPKPAWTQTKEVQSLTAAYIRTLTTMTGTINDAAWKFWYQDEVLFLGARARRRGRGVWRMEFFFAIQPTTDESVQTESGAQNFTKPGWDYLWFQRKQKGSGGGASVEHSIKAAHVARVYKRTDFNLLGLGK